MGKELEPKQDKEWINAMHKFQLEAATNAVNAFTEGYLLGMRHANNIFKELAEDEDTSNAS